MSNTASIEFRRQFVSAAADFGAWPAVEAYYRQLEQRPLTTRAELEQWLLDYSELDACFEEEGVRRYVAMTCQTDDPLREQRYLEFVEQVKPHREPWGDRLRRRFVEAAARLALPPKRYEVLERSARNSVALYRDRNVPLLTENEKLCQQYQKIVAAMTVQYQGQELTLAQLGRLLEEPERSVRENAWHLAGERFLADGARLDQLYHDMVILRHQIARNADCPDYRTYMFRALERFDYSPDDCLAFHDAIEKVVVPATRQLAEARRRKLNLPTLRPWDTVVSTDGGAPLRPFASDAQLAAGCSAIFHRVSPELGQVFDTLRDRQLLDLGNRKGKAPGGYQQSFPEQRVPFIFMNAVGTEADVRTLLHEGGHAFHAWAVRHEPLLPYRTAPMEFCEVASMGMELLCYPHLEQFYAGDVKRARRRFLEDIVSFFPWMARVDAFQHHVYTNIDADPEQRKDYWQALTRRFAPELDYRGLERFDRHSWHRKLHFFEVPFYYVEYGIAQLGALQVWLNSRKDYSQAVALYRNGLALGGARPLPELFEAAGLKFDFSEATLRPLIDAAMDELARLEG